MNRSLILLAVLALTLQTLAEPLSYPKTEKHPHRDTYHGISVDDPFHWLEDDLSDQTAAWVKAQNKVTFGYLEEIPFREKVEDRIEQLLNYERISAPSKEGSYQYFYKNDGLQDHDVVYRHPLGDKEKTKVLLDPNTWSDDGTVGLRGMSFSKDGSLVAYLITEGGSDWRKLKVLDTETEQQVGETLDDLKFSYVAWKKNEGFFYSSYDNPEDEQGSELSSQVQHHKLLYHKLGTSQDEDELIFGGERQPNRYIGGYVTEDQRYLVVTAAQTTTGNQVFIKDLEDPGAEFITVQDDYEATTDVIANVGSRFYLLTNKDAPNYRVVSLELSSPGQWTDVISETENVLSAASGGGKLFANYLIDAKTAVHQYDLSGRLEREIELPGIGTASGFNAKEDDQDLYYSFTSFTEPSTIYHYDITSGESTLYRRPKVDFRPEDYETKQVFFESRDGTRVPMFITHKKGLELNGKNPTLLYSYGGFNISLRPSFSSTRVLWLENGGVYAQPNIRGGGEYGETWHLAGTKMKKQNVFDDFIAAAEYLVENKYTSSDYLAIQGGSNGGLLVGAVMTQRPELAKVALPAVGVLDMLRYHKFTAGAGWATDYGTADDSAEMFEYLRGYSPYHNLKKGTAYPATLITTADHDDRVVPAHSFKFAARLQETHAGEDPVLIRIQTKAGHGSVSTRQIIELYSDIYSFIWSAMGLKPSSL